MTLSEWIQKNRQGIDDVIMRKAPELCPQSDKEREMWVRHFYDLWWWAKSERVNFDAEKGDRNE